MEPRAAALRIVNGIERRKRRILVGEDAKLVARVQRLYPVCYGRMLSEMAEAKR